jgi:hypothetical protein
MTDTVGSEPFDVKLGRLPSRSSVKALHLADFLPDHPQDMADPPKKTNFWSKRKNFSSESWGNKNHGCCTIAKQANMFRRLERLERRQTITITEQEVLAKYYAMTEVLYGGGDTGAYETDALSRSRRSDQCLCDSRGHHLLIDAYVRVDAFDHGAVRRAMALAGAHGLAVCISLPTAFSTRLPPDDWDIPETQPAIGIWRPGSWGGHSMWAVDYDEIGIWLEHTWELPLQRLSWRAAAYYMDEVHVVIDSVNAWKKRLKQKLDVAGIVDAVNAVSSTKIAF